MLLLVPQASVPCSFSRRSTVVLPTRAICHSGRGREAAQRAPLVPICSTRSSDATSSTAGDIIVELQEDAPYEQILLSTTSSSSSSGSGASTSDSLSNVDFDADKKVVRVPLAALEGASRRTRMVSFTCNKCDGRTTRLVNPKAWDHGLVLCQCATCKVWHTLAANNPRIYEEIIFNKEKVSVVDGQVSEQ